MKSILNNPLRRFTIIFCIALFSCESDDEEAMKLVQTSRIQFVSDSFAFQGLFLGQNDLTLNSTWSDFANAMAKRDKSKKYKWKSNQASEVGIFVVGFVDDEGWGWNWEVTLKEQIVKFINDSDYLNIKYGFSRFGGIEEFQITKLKLDTLKIVNTYNHYDGKYEKAIVYQMRGEMLNKTDKKISSGSIKGNLKLVFKDKTINGINDYNSEFIKKLSKSNTWNPNTTREFRIQTKGIEAIYLDYKPEYVILEVGIAVEDPIGFSFDKNILENDIIHRWTNLQVRQSENKTSTPRTKTSKENKDKARIKEPLEKPTEGIKEKPVSVADEQEGRIETEAKYDKKAAYGKPKEMNQLQTKSGDLSAWKIDGIKVPTLPDNETGRIVFEIKVSDTGEVLEIKTIESSISREAEDLMLKAVQSQNLEKTQGKVPPISTGQITFIIRSN